MSAMIRLSFLVIPIGVVSVPFVGCTGGGGTDPVVEATSAGAMVTSQFDPRDIHSDPGTTVTWTNEDTSGHTVLSAPDNWTKDNRVDTLGESSHRFEGHGVDHDYCRFHGSAGLTGMGMKIAVDEGTTENLPGIDPDNDAGYD